MHITRGKREEKGWKELVDNEGNARRRQEDRLAGTTTAAADDDDEEDDDGTTTRWTSGNDDFTACPMASSFSLSPQSAEVPVVDADGEARLLLLLLLCSSQRVATAAQPA